MQVTVTAWMCYPSLLKLLNKPTKDLYRPYTTAQYASTKYKPHQIELGKAVKRAQTSWPDDMFWGEYKTMPKGAWSTHTHTHTHAYTHTHS